MMRFSLVVGILILVFLACNRDNGARESFFNKKNPVPAGTRITWNEINNGIWLGKAGNPEAVDLLRMAGIKACTDGLDELTDVEFPLDNKEIEYVRQDGKTYLRFPLQKTEQIYGLGLNFKTVHQRGRILRLHVDHYGGEDNGRTHAPVPFYISNRGYGVFINSARYIDIWVGTAVRKDSKNPPPVRDRNTDPAWDPQPPSDTIEILVPAEGTEIYVIGGPTMMDVVRRYNLFCGGGVLPPKWGLGFWHRVPTLYSADDARQEIREFREHDFPLSVLGLEPGWQSRSYPCTYEWDKGRFPNPKEFIDELNTEGIRVNLWLNPYISPESEIYEKLLPYTGTHTVWCGPVPDYTIPEARAITENHFRKYHLDLGVSGYKIDESDGFDVWLWPDVAQFPSGLSAEQMRQTYGVQLQRMTAELFREQNLRTYGLTRATNGGTSSFPFVLYNDYYSHRDFITALINSSFSGILWTPEVRGSESGEEWLRRMQTVCFSPMAMINAWADKTKPWSFPEVYPAVREIAGWRNRFIPYLYTAFARYAFEGIPPIRAMQLSEWNPADEAYEETEHSTINGGVNRFMNMEMKDQFMFGEDLLVAPLFASETQRRVVLPPGKWFDFYTGAYAGEGGVITIAGDLDTIPLFVRNGAVIPLAPEKVTGLHAPSKIPLEIRHYGDIPGSFRLYDDDGETFAYENGAYNWTKISVSETRPGQFTGETTVLYDGFPSAYHIETYVIMTGK